MKTETVQVPWKSWCILHTQLWTQNPLLRDNSHLLISPEDLKIFHLCGDKASVQGLNTMADDVKCFFIVSHLTLSGWLGSPMSTRLAWLRRSRSRPGLRSTPGDVITDNGQLGVMLHPPPGSRGHTVTLRIYLEGWSLKKQCLGWDLKSKGKEGSSPCRRNCRDPGQWWEDIGEGGI